MHYHQFLRLSYWHPAQLSSSGSFVSGLVAGLCARTVVCPFDVMKLKMQINRSKSTLLSTAQTIYSDFGIKGFWTGNVISCINQGPQSAIKFLSQTTLENFFGDYTSASGTERYLIGSVAGIISQTIVFPLDVIYTHSINNPMKYPNLISSAYTIYKEGGIRTFWRGLKPTVLGAIIYEGSQYYCYSSLRDFFAKRNHGYLDPWTICAIGAISGIVSQTASFPFDTVRRRVMIDKNKGLNHSLKDCFLEIVHGEGIMGLFKGIELNLIKMIPYGSVQYLVYEELKRFFMS